MPSTHDSKPFLLMKGPLIVSLESIFWHRQRYPSRRVSPVTPPLHETARPRELEDPYRIGHGHVFRLPLTRQALVVGFWEPQLGVVLDEEENDRLIEAVEGAHIPGITASEIRDWAYTRNWSWLELLVRRYPALGHWVERLTGSGVNTSVPYLKGVQPIEPEGDDPRVTPWADVPIIDLEEARVEGRDSDRHIIERSYIGPDGIPMPIDEQDEFRGRW